MSKVFEVVDGICINKLPFTSLTTTITTRSSAVLFVQAPDYVFPGWGYRNLDDDGNPINGDDCFIKPVAPEGYFYNDETGAFVADTEFATFLATQQNKKQEMNKNLLAEFLAAHPLTWSDGKQYGVTMEDQSEINLNLTQYQIQLNAGIETPILEWHAIHEECRSWTYEELSGLALTIAGYIYPYFRLMQNYKASIFAATNIDELEAIELVYDEDSGINTAAV